MEAIPARPPGSRSLIAACVVLLAVVWLEPRGSALAEPDETRYAEIPREMLAANDLLIPRLNGVPYFEKPPLLYWVNAASLRIFGETPWAARLPTRLAGFGTTLLVLFAASRSGIGAAAGTGSLAAAVFFLAAPIGFLFSRTNLTDGLLTFFFTATLLSGRAAVLRRESGRPWMSMAALFGAMCAAAFLTKGLAAIVLSGSIFFIWAVSTGRLVTTLRALLLSPAPVVFLVLAVPWFLAVESRHPGFLDFFFIREHFQRFATKAAKRTGPLYYFVPVLLLGFLPGIPFFVRGFWKALRGSDPAFFYFVWFTVVFVFFSVSGSKLPPYLFPAIPAAAVLAARGLPEPGERLRPAWIAGALLTTAFAAALILHPELRAAARELRLAGIVAPALAILVLLSWFAVLFAGNAPRLALSSLGFGWAAFLLAVVLGWPLTPQARFTSELADAARRTVEAAKGKALLVGYKDYLNGISWELKRPIPVAAYRGELEPEFESSPRVRDSLFWSDQRFWIAWKSSRPVVALVRTRDLVEMMTAQPPARVVRFSNRHAIVANFPE
jgi:4-amino-4-deoxy-L-arabinose transferase-like glycosyltransferase